MKYYRNSMNITYILIQKNVTLNSLMLTSQEFVLSMKWCRQNKGKLIRSKNGNPLETYPKFKDFYDLQDTIDTLYKDTPKLHNHCSTL